MGNISYAYDCGYKDGAHEGYQLALRDLQPVIDAAKKTLEENLHLCDGDICTLKDLRSAVENLPYSCRKRITPRVSGGAVCRPLDPLVMRFINKEELMTGNEDLTVQFGEDPPWDDLPPVDREKANKELESRLIFDSWTCRFCGGTFADRTRAIKHAIDCDDNEDVHSCATCASYEIGEDTRDGYRHICKGNPKRIDTWMKHCPEWIGA